MIRYLSVAALIAVGATTVIAQNLDVIKERRQAMRAIVNQSSTMMKMSKGETAFDLAQAQAALKVMGDQAAKFKTLFPDNSRTGGSTEAAPKIWAERAQFDAVSDKWVAVIREAATAIKDEASFKAEYSKVSSGCGGCHKSTGDGYAPRVGDLVKKPAP